MDELTFLPPEKIDELNDTDQLTTDDGKTYTLAQLLDLKHKDLVAEVKRLKKSTREAEEAKAEAEAVATSLNDQMEQLGDANETAKALIETRKQLEKLEGEKVTRDRALEYWKKVDDGIMSLLTIAENIPLTRNHETDGYGRRVIENIILKAHNIATEKKFNVLGLSGEDS